MSDARTARRATQLALEALKRAEYDLMKVEVRSGRSGLFSNSTIERHAADMATNALRFLKTNYGSSVPNPAKLEVLTKGEIAFQWATLANGPIPIDPKKYIRETRQAIEAMKQAGRGDAEYLERLLNKRLGAT
jgi:hypothetical protein